MIYTLRINSTILHLYARFSNYPSHSRHIHTHSNTFKTYSHIFKTHSRHIHTHSKHIHIHSHTFKMHQNKFKIHSHTFKTHLHPFKIRSNTFIIHSKYIQNKFKIFSIHFLSKTPMPIIYMHLHLSVWLSNYSSHSKHIQISFKTHSSPSFKPQLELRLWLCLILILLTAPPPYTMRAVCKWKFFLPINKLKKEKSLARDLNKSS